LALIQLLNGDFEAGWPGREARWKISMTAKRKLACANCAAQYTEEATAIETKEKDAVLLPPACGGIAQKPTVECQTPDHRWD
jgi:hypothetical protein